MTRLVPMTEEQAKRLREWAVSGCDCPDCELPRSLADAYNEGLTEEEAWRLYERTYYGFIAPGMEHPADKLRTLLPEEAPDA